MPSSISDFFIFRLWLPNEQRVYNGTGTRSSGSAQCGWREYYTHRHDPRYKELMAVDKAADMLKGKKDA
jgi:hypothetical protein